MAKRRMTPEQIASENVELAAPSLGVTLLRNNNGACYNDDGRLIRYGLGHVSGKEEWSSGDFVGWTRVKITPDMVGKTVAIFTVAEIKPANFVLKPEYRKGSREAKQQAFNQLVIDNGGFGMIARSGEDLTYYINYFTNWLKS